MHQQLILKSYLRHILLRRTKDMRINDVPILSLPPRIITLRRDFFTEEEAIFYEGLRQESSTEFKSFEQSNTVLKNYAHILELLLRLRQACNHQSLVVNRTKVYLSCHTTNQYRKKIGQSVLQK